MGIFSPITALANPARFSAFSARALPWLSGVTAPMLALGLYLGLVVAPADYQQGETVRIMFLHVPSAWLGMMGYTVMAAASLGVLIWRHPLADVA
ncbi:MAG TPA: cytochrome c biogenesis protein CcsA, partial [Hansschlegelia sp.]